MVNSCPLYRRLLGHDVCASLGVFPLSLGSLPGHPAKRGNLRRLVKSGRRRVASVNAQRGAS
eukprot:10874620-Lingulodinium_polyedra.AAC.1